MSFRTRVDSNLYERSLESEIIKDARRTAVWFMGNQENQIDSTIPVLSINITLTYTPIFISIPSRNLLTKENRL